MRCYNAAMREFLGGLLLIVGTVFILFGLILFAAGPGLGASEVFGWKNNDGLALIAIVVGVFPITAGVHLVRTA
jgi:hypothetical protein